MTTDRPIPVPCSRTEREAQEQKDRQKDIADAEGREKEAKRDSDFKKMDPVGQIKELERRKGEILKEAEQSKKSDPAKAADLRAEAIKLQDDIDQRKKDLADEMKQKASEEAEKNKPKFAAVAGDSLQAIGGGGFAARGSGDHGIRLQEKQVSLQEQTVRLLAQIAGAESKPIPSNPWK